MPELKLNPQQIEKIESLQDYLTRISHNLVRPKFFNANSDDLLQAMNEAILVQAKKTPTFLDQKPGFICKKAAWAARDYYGKFSHYYMQKAKPEYFNTIELDNTDEIQTDELFGNDSTDIDQKLTVGQILSTLKAKTVKLAQLLADGYKGKSLEEKSGMSRPTIIRHKKILKAALAGVVA